MNYPLHQGTLSAMAQPGQCEADRPAEGVAQAVRVDSYTAFAAWLLKTFREAPALESVTVTTTFRMEPWFSGAEDTEPSDIVFHTEFELSSTGETLFSDNEASMEFVSSFLPTWHMGRGSFTFDRSAYELKALSDLPAEATLDVRMLVHRLATRLQQSFHSANVTRTVRLKS